MELPIPCFTSSSRSLAPWGLYLCCSLQNLQAVGQGMVHNWSFTNICWVNKHIGNSSLWYVVISGGQQSRDSRCHGRIHEVPFHTLQVIPHYFKGLFPYDSTLPSVEQPPFLLEWEQVLYQEQIIFSFNIHRGYWGKFPEIILFLISLIVFICSFIWWYQAKYIWLIFEPFQSYSVILKICSNH